MSDLMKSADLVLESEATFLTTMLSKLSVNETVRAPFSSARFKTVGVEYVKQMNNRHAPELLTDHAKELVAADNLITERSKASTAAFVDELNLLVESWVNEPLPSASDLKTMAEEGSL